MADDVTIGHGSPVAAFRSAARSGSGDPYAGSSFMVELHSDGVRAIRSVFMSSSEWDALAAYFSDLANSWRGGKARSRGNRSSMIFGSLPHPTRWVIANWTWKTVVGGFKVDAGEDMATVAREMLAWAGST